MNASNFFVLLRFRSTNLYSEKETVCKKQNRKEECCMHKELSDQELGSKDKHWSRKNGDKPNHKSLIWTMLHFKFEKKGAEKEKKEI